MTVTVGVLLLRTPRNPEEAPSLKRENAKQEIVHTKNDALLLQLLLLLLLLKKPRCPQ